MPATSSLLTARTRRRTRRVTSGLFLACLCAAPAAGQRIVFVDMAAGGAEDGTTWTNAYVDLQDALAELAAPDECTEAARCQIWVASGNRIYRPDRSTDDRDATFLLLDHVALYGGFAGGETSLDQRDWETNVTILSGDLNRNDWHGGPNGTAENSYHVVRATGVGATAVMDGFTISGGNANGQGAERLSGGGLFIEYANPTIANCIFSDNYGFRGGGLHLGASSTLLLANCTFCENDAGYGGGIYAVDGGLVVLTGCAFTNNTAGSGGAVYTDNDTTLTMTGCNFDSNQSSEGGAIFDRSDPVTTLTSCTFAGNSAVYPGGAIARHGGALSLLDCAFSHNLSEFSGGAIHGFQASLTLRTCTFMDNAVDGEGSGSGGAIASSDGEILAENCDFYANTARREDSFPDLVGGLGGALFTSSDAGTLVNCRFYGNVAGRSGGAVAHYGSSSMEFHNCAFGANRGYAEGGAVYAWSDGELTFTNCTFSGNDAHEGRAIRFQVDGAPDPGEEPTCRILNSILWDGGDEIAADEGVNLVVRYSDVQGGSDGAGNIDVDPVFVAPAGLDGLIGTVDDDLRLSWISPCIDAGDNQAVASDALDLDGDGDTDEPLPFDLVGTSRFADDVCTPDTGQTDPAFPNFSIVDMGAYEYPELLPDDADADGVLNCQDNCPMHWNVDQDDCDSDGIGNLCSLILGRSKDCNGNTLPDECDLAEGNSLDDDHNQILDECQRVLRVDADAAGDGDGTTWATAFDHLQDALDGAANNDMIWVRAGEYVPTALTDANDGRSATFQLVDGVGLYGGFAGFETRLSERDSYSNTTVLSGDILGDDVGDFDDPTRSDNCYHVLSGAGTARATVLDGFTITAGHADGPFTSPESRGGGMLNEGGSPTIADCRFRRNYGDIGGALSNRAHSDPLIVGCSFTENAASYGAGCYTRDGRTILVNSLFVGNQADTTGGGVRILGGSSMVINCVFIGNSAFGGSGGAVAAEDPFYERIETTLVNCTFVANYAANGGGYHSDSALATITNCVFWDNRDRFGETLEAAQLSAGNPAALNVDYSCIQGWTGDLGGVGNIGANPSFVDIEGADNVVGTEDDNLRLLPGSPCSDAGDNESVPADTFDLDHDGDVDEPMPFDLDWNPRFIDDPNAEDTGEGTPPIVAMGAYEVPAQGFLIVGEPLTIEEGQTASFSVALALNPGVTVEVTVEHHSGDADVTVDAGASLTFHPFNYAEPQWVTLSAAEDADYLHGDALIHVSAPGMPATAVLVIEQDDDVPAVIYVDDDAPGADDGTTWENAYRELAHALNVARVTPQITAIHIAQGLYTPDEAGGDRAATFQLMNGLAVSGGFAGYGALNPDERDIIAYETVLSGDLNGDDVGDLHDPSRADNSYHVVTTSDTDETAVLDGLTITAGHGVYEWPHYEGNGIYNLGGSPILKDLNIVGNATSEEYGRGGGMFSTEGNAVLTRCTFRGNWADAAGGAMASYASNDSVTLVECSFFQNTTAGVGGALSLTSIGATLQACTFIENSAVNAGGAIFHGSANLDITKCRFLGNASGGEGGAIRFGGASERFMSDCVLSGNVAAEYGGALAFRGSHMSLSNCSFAANSAPAGRALGFDSVGEFNMSTVEVSNCVLVNDGDEIWIDDDSEVTVVYSDVQGGWPGEGNFDLDPLFIDPDGADNIPGTEDDNLRLSPGSPCINTGDPDFDPGAVHTDLDGHTRILCGLVDMGAYEFGIGDYDCDQTVDLSDFAAWAACMTGPHGGPYEPGCEPFDFNADGDIDLEDLAGFQRAFGGP